MGTGDKTVEKDLGQSNIVNVDAGDRAPRSRAIKQIQLPIQSCCENGGYMEIMNLFYAFICDLNAELSSLTGSKPQPRSSMHRSESQQDGSRIN